MQSSCSSHTGTRSPGRKADEIPVRMSSANSGSCRGRYHTDRRSGAWYVSVWCLGRGRRGQLQVGMSGRERPLVLAVIAALAAWVGSLYLRPFGRCGKCAGRGHIKSGKRRVKVCPRCKGAAPRPAARLPCTIHRLARKIRDGRQAAARYQEDSDGTP